MLQGTVSFADGATEAPVRIDIAKDPSFVGDRSFTLKLDQPTMGGLGLQSSTNVSVVDTFGTADSVTAFARPAPLPATNATLTIETEPPEGQWRLEGEVAWRHSGTLAARLAAGNYNVEFKPLPGYYALPPQLVPIAQGERKQHTAAYVVSGEQQAGRLAVLLQPAEIAERAQWQVVGDSVWHNSGESLEGLPPGLHAIRFSYVPGRATPPAQNVYIQEGETTQKSATYFIADAQVGNAPQALNALSEVTETHPYWLNGQVQTDLGYGSGTVVRDRAVLTAAHVLFDDVLLSYATGVKWHFQRHEGGFKEPSKEPRGWYVFGGYASRRTLDNSPGVSSPESQNLDVAAMFFYEAAGRQDAQNSPTGGYSGYLVSDAANEWLADGGKKELVGYPVDGVADAAVGRMHATSPQVVRFERRYKNVYVTTDLRGFPGTSGGALYLSSGLYSYPAGIYLGGTGETLVRAIDGEVADLISRAQDTGHTEDDHTGGGPVRNLAGPSTSQLVSGKVRCTLTPDAAIAAGARWKVVGYTGWLESDTPTERLLRFKYEVQFKEVPGYETPPPRQVPVGTPADSVAMISADYVPGAPPVITSRAAVNALQDRPFEYRTEATLAPEKFSADNLPQGLVIDPSTGIISGKPLSSGLYSVRLSAKNVKGWGELTLTLVVYKPASLLVELGSDAGAGVNPGKVTKGFAGESERGLGQSVTIIATPSKGWLFKHWEKTNRLSDQEPVVVGQQPQITLVMEEGMILRAIFVPNPFLKVNGSYNGLLETEGHTLAPGFIQVAVTASGAFTGKVTLDGKSYKMKKGSFVSPGPMGHFETTISLPNQQSALIKLDLNLISGTDQLIGTVTRADGQLATVAHRAVFIPKVLPAPQAGTYNVRLSAPSPADAAAAQQAAGSGILTITSAGAGRFLGKLGDGTSVRQSFYLSKAGVWPLYLTPKAGNGWAAGHVEFGGFLAPDRGSAIAWRPSNTLDEQPPRTVTIHGARSNSR